MIAAKMRTLRLLFTFYTSYAIVSLLITCCCLIISFTYGIGTFTALFWFKIVTLGLIFYFINSYKRDEYYYYKNLGLHKRILWISTLSFDILLFILLFILSIMIR